MPDDPSDRRPGCELPHLVEQRSHNSGLLAACQSLEPAPVRLKTDGIVETAQHLGADALVKEQARQIEQRRARTLGQGQQTHVGELSGSRTPVGLPEPLEQLADLIRHKRRIVRPGERVEANGVRAVGRIEQDHIAGSLRRDEIEHVPDEIPIGLNHRQAATLLQVVADQVLEQTRLSSTCRPEHVQAAG